MARALEDVTEAELDVLKLLWERGASSIRELSDVLYPGGSVSHYATVQKLLERLEAKAWVKHRAAGRLNRFVAARERSALIEHRLRRTANALCEGSLAPLLTQLVSSVALTREQVAELRQLVERAERRKKGGAP